MRQLEERFSLEIMYSEIILFLTAFNHFLAFPELQKHAGTNSVINHEY